MRVMTHAHIIKKSCVSKMLLARSVHPKDFYVCVLEEWSGLEVGVLHSLSILRLAEVE